MSLEGDLHTYAIVYYIKRIIGILYGFNQHGNNSTNVSLMPIIINFPY